jgi:hypothetical protein
VCVCVCVCVCARVGMGGGIFDIVNMAWPARSH